MPKTATNSMDEMRSDCSDRLSDFVTFLVFRQFEFKLVIQTL